LHDARGLLRRELILEPRVSRLVPCRIWCRPGAAAGENNANR
jgi:hypothetical protein